MDVISFHETLRRRPNASSTATDFGPSAGSLLFEPRCSLRPFALCLFVLAITLVVAGCGPKLSEREKLALEIEERLSALDTVQGNLTIRQDGVQLSQEFWLERPKMLRTETELGPDAFQGTIVVLNKDEGWFYNPALNLATLSDRSEYHSEAAEAGAGSRMERLPTAVLDALRRGYPLHNAGEEQVAGRPANHLEVYVEDANPAFPIGPLHLWLDEEFAYPLAYRDSSGLDIRFASVLFNQAIDPLTFEFVPPPGARVERAAPKP